MILHAGNGCFLTQVEDVPFEKRVFRTSVTINRIEDSANWKEITQKAKEEMQAEKAIIDVDNMTVESLDNVDALLMDIAGNINSVDMTDEEAIEKTHFFPEWANYIGQVLAVGFRLQSEGLLYEVIQEHTAAEEWKPGEGTESLFKRVSNDPEAGTKENPIVYDGNMALENGKYYTQGGVLYLCTRDTVNPVYNDLADLVGIYVEVVENV